MSSRIEQSVRFISRSQNNRVSRGVVEDTADWDFLLSTCSLSLEKGSFHELSVRELFLLIVLIH